MSKFKCTNKDCVNLNKPVEVDNSYWEWSYKGVFPTQEQKDKDIECKGCEMLMEKHITPTNSNKAPAYLRFASLPDSEKKKILGKRANEAYKKEGGAEKKLLKQRETINKMKNRM